MKNADFWDVALCRSYVKRRFGGTYRLHVQSAATCSRWFLDRGFFYPEDEGDYVPPKRRFTQDLHSATSQKSAFCRKITVLLGTEPLSSISYPFALMIWLSRLIYQLLIAFQLSLDTE
jgi:hypothetical protein